MQRKTLLTLCAAAVFATSALGLATARPANLGTPTNWQGDETRDWNTGGNWSNGVPHAGDTVNIPSNVPAGYKGDPVLDSGDDGLAGYLTIATGRTVTVTDNTLVLDGETQTFTGTLILSDSTAKVEFTYPQATDWVAISGSGGIEGKHASAEVRLNDSKIDSDSVLHGMMTVKEVGGTATFKNGSTGIVRANATGMLLLAAGLTLQDDGATCSTAIWEASGNSSAILKFAQSATGLTSLFRLDDCAVIEIAASVDIATVNTLKDKAGTATAEGYVKVGSGGSFVYRDSCPSGTQNTLTASCTLIGTECSACP